MYVAPKTEDLGKLTNSIDEIISKAKLPQGVRATLRGLGAGNAFIVQEFWHRPDAFRRTGVLDSRSPVPVIPGSIHHSFRNSTGIEWRIAHSSADRDNAEHHVAHGTGDDGGHRCFEQHSDRGFCAAVCGTRALL